MPPAAPIPKTRHAARAAARLSVQRRFLTRCGWMLAGAMGAALLATATVRLAAGPSWWWAIPAGLAVASALAAWVLVWAGRWSLAHAAGEVDRNNGTEGALRTGIEIEDADGDPSLVAMARARAEAVAGTVDPARGIPKANPNGWWAAIPVAGLCVAAGLFLDPIDRSTPAPDTGPIVQRALGETEQARQELEQVAEASLPDPESWADTRAEIEALEEELRRDGGEDAALRAAAALERAADELEAQSERDAQAEQAAREAAEMFDAPDEEPTGLVDRLADALARNDMLDAEQAARELDRAAETLSESDRRRLADTLEDLADRLGSERPDPSADSQDVPDGAEPSPSQPEAEPSTPEDPAEQSEQKPQQNQPQQSDRGEDLSDALRERAEELREQEQQQAQEQDQQSEENQGASNRSEDDQPGQDQADPNQQGNEGSQQQEPGQEGQPQNSGEEPGSEPGNQQQQGEPNQQQGQPQQGPEPGQQEPGQQEPGQQEPGQQEPGQQGEPQQGQEPGQQPGQEQPDQQQGQQQQGQPEPGQEQQGQEQPGQQQGEQQPEGSEQGDQEGQQQGEPQQGEPQQGQEPQGGQGQSGEQQDEQQNGQPGAVERAVREMRERQQGREKNRRVAESLRERARDLMEEPGRGPSEPRVAERPQGGAGDGDRLAQREVDRGDFDPSRFEPVDASGGTPEPGSDERVVGDWFDPERADLPSGTSPEARERLGDAARRARDAVDNQQVPRRYRDFIRRVFDRVEQQSKPASGGPASEGPAPQGQDADP